tara:strand:- start:2554 stop:2793 length:240 start_codon:yes stop_codon:yes gene_type:complete
MPSYPLINKNTGEKKTLTMTMTEYDSWKKENSDWQRDWSEGCASSVSEVGDWRNKVPSDLQKKINTIKKSHYGSTIQGF